MNLSSDNNCSRLSPEELVRLNMPQTIPAEPTPEEVLLARTQEMVLTLRSSVSELTRQTRQMQETLRAMEEQHRRDLRTIEDQQKEMKKLFREKEEQVGRILDLASHRTEKSVLRDEALWWLRLLLTALPAILILLLAVFQGWLPLFQ